MKKSLILIAVITFSSLCTYSQGISVMEDTSSSDAVAYISHEDSLQNECFAIGDTVSCIEHLRNITVYFQKNKRKCIKNTAICDIVYHTYCNLYFLDKTDAQQGIAYLKEALSLVAENKAWAKQFKWKKDVVNHYSILVGELVKDNDLKAASKYNEEMVKYGEFYYRTDLPDVLLDACVNNWLMGRSDDSNYPIYKRLYTMYDELDKIQRYEVVKRLIFFEYDKENYTEVIKYAKLHSELINKSSDEVKDAILNFIGLSYCRYADLLSAKHKKLYDQEVNDFYTDGYNWAKLYNKPFLPEMIICWAYYLYGFESHETRAVELFYEFLDCLQSTTDASHLFEHTYYDIEDAQQALISIILVDIIETTQPKDLNGILNRYDKVVPYLLTSGEYVQDLKAVIQLAHEYEDNYVRSSRNR